MRESSTKINYMEMEQSFSPTARWPREDGIMARTNQFNKSHKEKVV